MHRTMLFVCKNVTGRQWDPSLLQQPFAQLTLYAASREGMWQCWPAGLGGSYIFCHRRGCWWWILHFLTLINRLQSRQPTEDSPRAHGEPLWPWLVVQDLGHGVLAAVSQGSSNRMPAIPADFRSPQRHGESPSLHSEIRLREKQIFMHMESFVLLMQIPLTWAPRFSYSSRFTNSRWKSVLLNTSGT